MDAINLAARLTGRPITEQRIPKFVRHVESLEHFEATLAAIADEATREQVRTLAGPAVRRKFGR